MFQPVACDDSDDRLLRVLAQDRGTFVQGQGAPSEVTALRLASRIEAPMVIQVEPGGVGSSWVRRLIRFPAAGVVTELSFIERNEGIIVDQWIQLRTPTTDDQAFGRDEAGHDEGLSCAALFGSPTMFYPGGLMGSLKSRARPRRCAYWIPSEDEVWEVAFRSTRPIGEMRPQACPVLIVHFLQLKGTEYERLG